MLSLTVALLAVVLGIVVVFLMTGLTALLWPALGLELLAWYLYRRYLDG